MKAKYGPILKDGLILVIVSTLFVTAVNQFFSYFKKTSASDNLVTAIIQSDVAGVKEILSEKEFQKLSESRSLASVTDVKSANSQLSNFQNYLLERTQRVDDQGRTPLMWVAYMNLRAADQRAEAEVKHTEMAQILLTAGADLNLKDHDGWTALMWSSWSGLKGVSQLLLSKGADLTTIDKNGNSALLLAAQQGHVEIVKMILEQKNEDIATSMDSLKKVAEIGLNQYPEKKESYRAILNLIDSKS